MIAVPTLVGSLLSFLGSSTAIAFQISRPPQQHFRHSLILNLLVADLIYGLGNTISGAVFLEAGTVPTPATPPTTACLVSGWFSQSNAQAVDFNILIIAIVVLLSVIRKDKIAYLDLKWHVLICMAAWVPGIITGTIGLLLGSYGYIGGNWCWINSNRLDLRYALSHGWRIAIFFATIIIYTYVYITLRRVFSNIRRLSGMTGPRSRQEQQVAAHPEGDNDTQMILISHSVSVSHETHNISRKQDTPEQNDGYNNRGAPHSSATTVGTQCKDGRPFENSRIPAPPNLRKMLLMNGYPLAYIILWIPGIASRLAESVGGSPRWLQVLQASTQYIGLVNALTYGMSEQMRRGFWRKLKDTDGQS
ncbi:hypothetical protein LTR37_014842 [Vermiconidia calcicola]|uniref:Uncharacterized protein n=1 Tax=Vermiconidia calcicola TaxID=1690605 RepID=A0ACC3MSG3_9PEZI|nr:hypothetical protein LTR37_014842 [Vermiconidia calcicola]